MALPIWFYDLAPEEQPLFDACQELVERGEATWEH